MFPAQMLAGELRATHGNIQINPKVRIARYTQVRITHVIRHTSHVTRHTSHVTRHTSHVTRHTSHVTRHTSHFTRHTSHVIPHASHLTPHTSHLTPHTSHLTPHTCRRPSAPRRSTTPRLDPSRGNAVQLSQQSPPPPPPPLFPTSSISHFQLLFLKPYTPNLTLERIRKNCERFWRVLVLSGR
jgi:hypothetical protein